MTSFPGGEWAVGTGTELVEDLDTHPSIFQDDRPIATPPEPSESGRGQKDSHDRSQKLQNTDWHAKLCRGGIPSIHLSATVMDARDCRLTLLVWQASIGLDWTRKSSTFSC